MYIVDFQYLTYGSKRKTMEKRYKSISLFEFQQQFSDDQSCYDHLANLTRQCTTCGYQATPTSETLFHKVKFPILKAFYIVYFMATNKQGISSTELSRKLALRQKTCWAFKQKVMKAMAGS